MIRFRLWMCFFTELLSVRVTVFLFRILTSEAINDLSVREERYNKSLRLKKVLMGAVLVALFGLFLFVKYGKADEAQFSYDTGEIMSKGALKNGKKEGKWTSFYKNGNKELEITFKNGLINGEYNTFYENGNLKQSNLYVNGKTNGMEKAYFENGRLNWEVNVINDKQEGIYKRLL